MKFGVGFLYEDLSNKREFRENQLSDIRALLKRINDILYPFPPLYFLTDLTEIDQEIPLSR